MPVTGNKMKRTVTWIKIAGLKIVGHIWDGVST